ncbi:hypothetical protein LX36DRAFT_1913 [Colletotrichum falcatum]|nr:hypothetical protein LX36DRAFT_1913 [Colletotrichum falcatum]
MIDNMRWLVNDLGDEETNSFADYGIVEENKSHDRQRHSSGSKPLHDAPKQIRQGRELESRPLSSALTTGLAQLHETTPLDRHPISKLGSALDAITHVFSLFCLFLTLPVSLLLYVFMFAGTRGPRALHFGRFFPLGISWGKEKATAAIAVT